MIACRSCVQVIGSENGIRSTITVFAVFASENSKAGRLRSGVFPAADTNSIVPLLDVLHDRTNGFIRKRRWFQR
jgi:hypothetical protein